MNSYALSLLHQNKLKVMKKAVVFILGIVLTASLFSCGSSKSFDLKQDEEVTFKIREKQEIMQRKIVQPQRTIIATP